MQLLCWCFFYCFLSSCNYYCCAVFGRDCCQLQLCMSVASYQLQLCSRLPVYSRTWIPEEAVCKWLYMLVSGAQYPDWWWREDLQYFSSDGDVKSITTSRVMVTWRPSQYPKWWWHEDLHSIPSDGDIKTFTISRMMVTWSPLQYPEWWWHEVLYSIPSDGDMKSFTISRVMVTWGPSLLTVSLQLCSHSETVSVNNIILS